MDSSKSYEFTCLNCGKVQKVAYRITPDNRRKYCNADCMNAYRAQQRQAAELGAKAAKAAEIRLKRPIVPLSKCKQCRFSSRSRDDLFCSYHVITGHSRVGLHPEGLTADCQEFQPKTKKRRKALSVK